MDWTILINGKAYAGPKVYAENCIRTAMSTMKKEKKYAVVAIEKDHIVEMKKEIFETRGKLKKAVAEYIVAGFKVHYVIK